MKLTIAVAYSGGLDTTWLTALLSKNHQVTAYMVDTGGFTESDIDNAQQRALAAGASKFICVNESETYYNKVIKYMIFGNILKNNTYPLSVSAERIIQAISIAEYAKNNNYNAIAHGCTGAGNDQVRFEMVFNILCPHIKILAPVREQNISRAQEIEYLKAAGIKMNFEKAKYSINKGLWGTSVGGAETLKSNGVLPDSAYPTQLSKSEPETLSVGFCEGEICMVNGTEFQSKVEAIKAVEAIAGAFAIGRDTHIGDTIIGIKGRVGFEAAAPLVLIKAHHALEKHVLTKWQLYWKENLSLWYGNRLHEGMLLDPEMRDIEQFFQSSQQKVTGTVNIQLMPYHLRITGIQSAHDLMNSDFGTYGEDNKAFTANDIIGFTKVSGLQSKIWYTINNENY